MGGKEHLARGRVPLCAGFGLLCRRRFFDGREKDGFGGECGTGGARKIPVEQTFRIAGSGGGGGGGGGGTTTVYVPGTTRTIVQTVTTPAPAGNGTVVTPPEPVEEPPVEIIDDPTPIAPPEMPETNWALLDLLLTILAAAMLVMLIVAISRKKDAKRKLDGKEALGLVLTILRIPVGIGNRYYCSQFISTLLSNTEATELRKRPNHYLPAYFKREKDIKLTFKGEIGDLNARDTE